MWLLTLCWILPPSNEQTTAMWSIATRFALDFQGNYGPWYTKRGVWTDTLASSSCVFHSHSPLMWCFIHPTCQCMQIRPVLFPLSEYNALFRGHQEKQGKQCLTSYGINENYNSEWRWYHSLHLISEQVLSHKVSDFACWHWSHNLLPTCGGSSLTSHPSFPSVKLPLTQPPPPWVQLWCMDYDKVVQMCITVFRHKKITLNALSLCVLRGRSSSISSKHSYFPCSVQVPVSLLPSHRAYTSTGRSFHSPFVSIFYKCNLLFMHLNVCALCSPVYQNLFSCLWQLSPTHTYFGPIATEHKHHFLEVSESFLGLAQHSTGQ